MTSMLQVFYASVSLTDALVLIWCLGICSHHVDTNMDVFQIILHQEDCILWVQNHHWNDEKFDLIVFL